MQVTRNSDGTYTLTGIPETEFRQLWSISGATMYGVLTETYRVVDDFARAEGLEYEPVQTIDFAPRE